MITLDDKVFIKNTAADLKNQINKSEKSFTLNHESLYIWCRYQEYLRAIMDKYNDDKEKLSEIIECIQIDGFSVCAKGQYQEEKEKVMSYINRITNDVTGDL